MHWRKRPFLPDLAAYLFTFTDCPKTTYQKEKSPGRGARSLLILGQDTPFGQDRLCLC